MKQKEIDKWFIENEKRITQLIKNLYYKFYKNFIDILEVDDLLDELYLYCSAKKYKFDKLSFMIISDKNFINYLMCKYYINIKEKNKFNKILRTINKIIIKSNYDYSLFNSIIDIAIDKHSKDTKAYRKVKKIYKKLILEKNNEE